MKKMMYLFFAMVMISYDCVAQTNQAPPTVRRSNDRERENARTSTSADGSFRDLRNLDIPQTFQKTPLEIIGQDIQPLYRKPNKNDLRDLTPSQPMLTQYDQFLKLSNTGIFKLSADFSCANNNTIIAATESCASNTIPGGGTAFSFRANTYRMLHLADLALEKDVIKTDGIMQQGIMVNLGDVELEKVSTETNGLRFLIDFKPVGNKEEMQKVDTELSNGINADGFIYRFGFYADSNTTFALRSIAYRGTMLRSIKGVKYNELDYDKRKDILVVFRIIEKDRNGDITIIWKEIIKKDSPNLKEN